jgi:hypothetical protein
VSGEFRSNSGQLWVINFYKRQLSMMEEKGLGGKTVEAKIEITPDLINSTKRRLSELEDEYKENKYWGKL